MLLITAEAIDELIARGYPLYYGALGENLTTRGLDRRQLRAGQRFRVGSALIELTKVRVPARTLDVYGAGHQSGNLRRAGESRRHLLAALGHERLLCRGGPARGDPR